MTRLSPVNPNVDPRRWRLGWRQSSLDSVNGAAAHVQDIARTLYAKNGTRVHYAIQYEYGPDQIIDDPNDPYSPRRVQGDYLGYGWQVWFDNNPASAQGEVLVGDTSAGFPEAMQEQWDALNRGTDSQVLDPARAIVDELGRLRYKSLPPDHPLPPVTNVGTIV